MTTVTVYHNVAADSVGRPVAFLDGYQPHHLLVLVHAIELPGEDHAAACEEVWRLLNVGHDPDFGTPDPDAVRYRERGNRSLAVGDVVAVDGVFYACRAKGWQRLEQPPTIAYRADVPGTTPLWDAVETLVEFLAVHGRPGRRVAVLDIGGEGSARPSIVVTAGDKAAVLQFIDVNPGTDAQHLCIEVHGFVAGRLARAGVYGRDSDRHVTSLTEANTAGTSHGWPASRRVAVVIGKQADAQSEGRSNG